jgi:uncharacterized protein (TIGR02246 family)
MAGQDKTLSPKVGCTLDTGMSHIGLLRGEAATRGQRGLSLPSLFPTNEGDIAMKRRNSQALMVLVAGALLGALAAAANFPLGPPAQAAPPGDVEEIITFEVRLPANAVLEIDGKKTTATGETRRFETPALRVGRHYTYTLKATANGKEVTREIDLTHGAKYAFDLRADLGAGDTKREAARIGEARPQDGKPEALTGKGKRAQEFIAAFDRGDAKAVAAFWMPDATYVDQTGRQIKGRAAIEKLYEKTFAAQKGAKLNIHVSSVKMLSDTVGLEEGVTEVKPANGGLASAAAFAAVLVKVDGEWYLESLRESVPRPRSNVEHFDDIEWLIGEWTGEATKGESGKASYAWAENQNFIVSSFATTVDGLPVVGGTQWIGWDPIDKQIRSWSFYSGGGFGEAVWTKDGDKWMLKTTARTAAGNKVSATNVLTRTDDDHVTWQMTKLTVDGEARPDPPPLKMKRVKPDKP